MNQSTEDFRYTKPRDGESLERPLFTDATLRESVGYTRIELPITALRTWVGSKG